ncbi:hypothetical protein BZA05DRAFT_421294 [Tricharina praecox]|uniref:uncharacterized protein n=1 Tax=Tricharina praecox TaxID=43433 RepID=UPI002221098C|nr:uncharacterized protein BZA05DRAFT_421294 [Tricharina praecox]KAI5845470.1 hypothetical protein BZA05DRAFT_421294 [Tricharina praecox]
MPSNSQPPRLTWRQYNEYQRLLREAQAPPVCSHCDSLCKQCTDLQARCVQLEGQLADATRPAAVENGSTDAESRQESPGTPNHERPGRIRRKAARAAARAAAAANIAAQEADAALDNDAGVLFVSDNNGHVVVESGSSAPTISLLDPIVSPPAALSRRSCLALRRMLIVWPALLVAAVLLFGIILSLPAATAARQALCPFVCPLSSLSPTAAFGHYGRYDALRWSSAKLDTATHCLPALPWPVSNKSEHSRAVTADGLRLPVTQASEMVHVITSLPLRGANSWATQLPPETRFYGTALLGVLIAGVIGA